MTIIALEGVRGTGKSTLWNQIKEKYPDDIECFKFPSNMAKECLKDHKYDMANIEDVISYNMFFVNDFITSIDHIYAAYEDQKLVVMDRYILSNLAHFKYDVFHLQGNSKFEWQGISRMLYCMFNNQMVLKPDMILYLQGEYKQPEEKFDDNLYKGKEDELKWYYDTELGNLRNKLDISFTILESLQPNTFDAVDSIIKRYIQTNAIE